MIKKSKYSSRRRFSESFRKARVKEYEKGLFTVSEISRQYSVSVTSVYNWLRKHSYLYKNGYVVVEQENSGSELIKKLSKRIEELERSVGQKQVNIEYLEMLIAKAGEFYSADLKKTFDKKQSKHSD
jgi:transposase-like protein